MTITGDAQQRIEAYLGRLRGRLRGINQDEVREIVEELRSHITDKAAASGETQREITPAAVDAALAALGSPEELASQYLTDNLLARAEVSRSPLQILRSLFRWASLSVAGFFVLLGSLFGYFFGVVFILVVETISSPRRRVVASSKQHGRFGNFVSNGLRECPGGSQRHTRLVDHPDRMDGRRWPDNADHASSRLVCPPVPQIARPPPVGFWVAQLSLRNSRFVSGYRFSDTASQSKSNAPLGAGHRNSRVQQTVSR